MSHQGNFICLTGTVRRAEEIGIIQRGTHRLIDLNGRVIAALSSNQVNLAALEGRFVTVCGINEGRIEGVISLRVTSFQPAFVPGTFPPSPQIDVRTLLLLLLLNPNLFRGINTNLLLAILLGGGLLGGGALGSGLGKGFGKGLGKGLNPGTLGLLLGTQGTAGGSGSFTV